jgi:RNA polymerase sigma factor (sigma-70 family)
MRFDIEQAEYFVNAQLSNIKKVIKKKIPIYEPLDFKTAYNGFMEQVRDEEYKIIREIPVAGHAVEHLESLIKNYLIECAYYTLEENYIQSRMMNKLGVSNKYEIKFQEIMDFVRTRLENNNLRKPKTFKEGSKFKTFLVTANMNLLIDYWRHKGSIKNRVTKYGPEFDTTFAPPVADPFNIIVDKYDDQLTKKRILMLPKILADLDCEEKLVYELKYSKNMKLSKIAKAMKKSRHKTKKIIQQMEENIKKMVLETDQGDNNETLRR